MVLKAISSMFGRLGAGNGAEDETSREHEVRLATALLLVEIARADYEVELTERQKVLALLKDFFELSESEAEALIEQANAEADHHASLQKFTRQLHEELTVEEKLSVVRMLWKVALADEHLDKHEDHLIRKVAGLLYIPHVDLIRIRNEVHPDHD